MALQIGPFVGESLPLVVPIVDSETNLPILNPLQVRIWLESPDGSVLDDKTLTGGEVADLGAGRFRAVFDPVLDGIHIARATVMGPDGISKSSRLTIEVFPI